jgi:transketolase
MTAVEPLGNSGDRAAADNAGRAIAVTRGLVMDAIERAGSGHPGAALALAPLAYVLYRQILKADPEDPGWPDRDRLVFSAGHAGLLQYVLLHLCGYRLSMDDLKAFRRLGSPTPGHPERGLAPGIEMSTGPLGQGLASAVGMAIAERQLAGRYNVGGYTVVDHRTFAVVSDGDLMEGVSQEAISIAGHLRLHKLILCYDSNGITIDGTTERTFAGEDQAARFRASGWAVERVEAFNDPAALHEVLARVRRTAEHPTLVIVKSVIGYPARSVQGRPAAHGGLLGAAEVARTKAAMGLDPEEFFAVPDDVYRHLDLRPSGSAARRNWADTFARWSEEFPDLRAEWDRVHSDGPPPKLDVPVFETGIELPPHKASKVIMDALADALPTMSGGAADLLDSTKTAVADAVYAAGSPARNLAFGVREHAMAAVVNGLALHGGITKPFGSTFLVFSDYMRPAVRLSALMGLPVLWLWTHDSVLIGPDGPTHQPVEHLPSLRAMPGLHVMRPCDANETAAAWQVAAARTDGPVALLLARQMLPNLAETAGRAPDIARGGYVLWDPPRPAELVIVATGSEIHPALAAARTLTDEGVPARLVSLPCWDLFEQQSPEYRESVLLEGIRPRLGVEAAAPLGWERWLGPRSATVAMRSFGASAPADQLAEHFGFTAADVVRAARDLMTAAPGDN